MKLYDLVSKFDDDSTEDERFLLVRQILKELNRYYASSPDELAVLDHNNKIIRERLRDAGIPVSDKAHIGAINGKGEFYVRDTYDTYYVHGDFSNTELDKMSVISSHKI